MLWRDVGYLIPVTTGFGDFGSAIEVDGKPIEVYGNKKSVRQSEFYQAAAVGMKPELVFEMMCTDYNDEPKVRIEETTYHVVRTYSKNGEKLEITLSKSPLKVQG